MPQSQRVRLRGDLRKRERAHAGQNPNVLSPSDEPQKNNSFGLSRLVPRIGRFFSKKFSCWSPIENASPSGHNFDDFELVAGRQITPREFRGCDGFAIMFHDHAARQQFLREQESFDAAWKLRLDAFAVGDDE